MSKFKILIVEDDVVLRELLEFLLQREGYETHCCNNGSEAQDWLRGSTPDLVLLDLQLPIISGAQLIQWLRNREPSRAIPILVLTSLQDDDDIANALDSGANDYMVKPFQPKELQARLRKLLNIQSQKRSFS